MDGLARYFDRIATKRISLVEASSDASNQHEFNGVATLTRMFGTTGRKTLDALHFDLDAMDEGPTHVQRLTWYDARQNHPTRTEWRLYYTPSLDKYLEEDGLLVLAQRGDSIFCFTARAGGLGERLYQELFHAGREPVGFQLTESDELEQESVSASAQVVLAELGLVPRDAVELEDVVIEQFADGFPTGEVLSAFARENTFGVDALAYPDEAIVAWLRVELDIFSILERRFASSEMDQAESLDEKLVVAMRVFQRRRSRAGKALEYHLKALLDAHEIRYAHTPETENGERPDFLFPSMRSYRAPDFPVELLTMLASKQTLRDRWRQVLHEAARIPLKHLFTTDPGLSTRQVEAMATAGLTLVVPYEIRSTYDSPASDQMMSVGDFIALVSDRQSRTSALDIAY